MSAQAFLKGVAIGFSIAVPVGPVGLLCIRRSLSHGRLAGFVAGLGAATADALYGVIAAVGLTAVTNALLAHHAWFQLVGGLFLLYFGLAIARSRPPVPQEPATNTASSLFASYLSTLAITLANPMTILSFIGIFAGFGIGATTRTVGAACLLVLGVFLGSAAWWFILSGIARWIGQRVEHGGLRAFNVVSGVLIAGFGAWQLVALVRTLR